MFVSHVLKGGNMGQGKGSMRERMPQCAAWVDEIREVFGRDSVDAAMRTHGYYAAEAGIELGSRSQGTAIGGADLVVSGVKDEKKGSGR
jgi:hypothetical protein